MRITNNTSNNNNYRNSAVYIHSTETAKFIIRARNRESDFTFSERSGLLPPPHLVLGGLPQSGVDRHSNGLSFLGRHGPQISAPITGHDQAALTAFAGFLTAAKLTE